MLVVSAEAEHELESAPASARVRHRVTVKPSVDRWQAPDTFGLMSQVEEAAAPARGSSREAAGQTAVLCARTDRLPPGVRDERSSARAHVHTRRDRARSKRDWTTVLCTWPGHRGAGLSGGDSASPVDDGTNCEHRVLPAV